MTKWCRRATFITYMYGIPTQFVHVITYDASLRLLKSILFRVTSSYAINSCFSTRPWLNNNYMHAIHNVLALTKAIVTVMIVGWKRR